MRFLLNEEKTFELAITLVLSVVHLSSQANDKEKIRTTLKTLMETYLEMSADLFPEFRRNAAHIGNYAMEVSDVDKLIQRDYYDLKKTTDYSYNILP